MKYFFTNYIMFLISKLLFFRKKLSKRFKR